MADHDTIWIPFGDETAEKSHQGYWVHDARRDEQEVGAVFNNTFKGVRIIQVRLVPVGEKGE